MLLFVGLDGEKKMFKFVYNYIGVSELLSEMFGKIMLIFDILMWSYYELFLFCLLVEIEQFKMDVESGINFCDIKILFVKEIIVCFYLEVDVDVVE